MSEPPPGTYLSVSLSARGQPLPYQNFADASQNYFENPSTKKLLSAFDKYMTFRRDVKERSPTESTQYCNLLTRQLENAEHLFAARFAERMFPTKREKVCPDVLEALAFNTFMHAMASAKRYSFKISRLSERFCLTGLLPVQTGEAEAFARELTEAVQASATPTAEAAVSNVARAWGDFLKSQESYYMATSGEQAALGEDSFKKFKSVHEAVTRIQSVSQLASAHWHRQNLVPNDARVIYHHPNKMIAEDAWTAARFILETVNPTSQETRGSAVGMCQVSENQEREQSSTCDPEALNHVVVDPEAEAASTSASPEQVLLDAYRYGSAWLQESRQLWTERISEWDWCYPTDTQTAANASEYDLDYAAMPSQSGGNDTRRTY